ncbi:MAG: phosphoenolpyruvate carboxykinase (GTP) [Candidatus Omnitrophica bacterium]|nr:phosphoenolpyruvate carboxykinase (GTP) [Candidatus Omnitrophota bacterium]
MDQNKELLKKKCGEKGCDVIMALGNEELNSFLVRYIELCAPASVFVRTDSDEDAEYIKAKAIENKEETVLATPSHSYHFDGYNDQARDKENTKFLVSGGENLSSYINSMPREEGLDEIHGYLTKSMKGKEAYVCFFCLGPTNSEFSIPAVQITDSSYVVHSEDILYRRGYEEFKKLADSKGFFKFIHSAGELDGSVSKNVDKRRVYIDLKDDTVLSVNTQYAGNTVGLKKLAMRLAIKKSSEEGWLTEHMFVMGVHGPGGRISYFTGAFPSACGKTSTAMIKGETIIGDDIAYLRKINGKIRTVNVERGIFGIIQDVNPEDDPLIWETLNSEVEAIFSNILVKDNKPYWLGDGREIPDEGINYSGQWSKGNKDKDGKEISHSHKNARYTIPLKYLKNCDYNLESPDGVEVKGIIYGGRDSDTSVPVKQAFNWKHGIITMGASLESETTAATLGKAGVRKFNLMSNLDFVSIPLGRYIKNNIEFPDGIDNPPTIFSVNYFLKGKDGKYLNGMLDKKVWIKWMELRANGDVDAIETPIGFIPKYNDLKNIFKQELSKEYTEQDYVEQFTLRMPENIAKIERIIEVYQKESSKIPPELSDVLNKQKERLLAARLKLGDYISPYDLQQ